MANSQLNRDQQDFPMEMDLSVLLPSVDSLQEVEDLHDMIDPPGQPLILSCFSDFLMDELNSI